MAAKNCTALKFKKGEYYTQVEGTTYEGKIDCYTIQTGANQAMTVELIGKSEDIQNTAFTIPDIVDGRDSFQFNTEKKTYQINVSQVKDVAEKKPYGLNVNVH